MNTIPLSAADSACDRANDVQILHTSHLWPRNSSRGWRKQSRNWCLFPARFLRRNVIQASVLSAEIEISLFITCYCVLLHSATWYAWRSSRHFSLFYISSNVDRTKEERGKSEIFFKNVRISFVDLSRFFCVNLNLEKVSWQNYQSEMRKWKQCRQCKLSIEKKIQRIIFQGILLRSFEKI